MQFLKGYLVAGLVALVGGVALAQSTRPSDRVVYQRADGRDVLFVPATGPAPVNRDAEAVRVLRPGGAVGEWVPAPAVPIAPALPVLERRVAPRKPSGDGVKALAGNLRDRQAITLRDLEVVGWRQNLAFIGVGPITLDNVRSIGAFRDDPSEIYVGQGLYADQSGPITLRGCVFAGNGWAADKPAANRNGYRHGVYANVTAGRVLAEDCVFANNAAAGIQLRNGGTLRRCVFVGNAIGVLAVRGDVLLEDCVFVGGGFYVNADDRGRVKSYAGNSAVYSYTKTTLRNCLVVGLADQGRSPAATIRASVNGAIATDRNHRDAPGVAGSIVCENVRVVGWPARTVPGVTTISGSISITDRPATIDVSPILARLLANEIAPAEAVRQIRAMAEQSIR